MFYAFRHLEYLPARTGDRGVRRSASDGACSGVCLQATGSSATWRGPGKLWTREPGKSRPTKKTMAWDDGGSTMDFQVLDVVNSGCMRVAEPGRIQ